VGQNLLALLKMERAASARSVGACGGRGNIERASVKKKVRREQPKRRAEIRLRKNTGIFPGGGKGGEQRKDIPDKERKNLDHKRTLGKSAQ